MNNNEIQTALQQASDPAFWGEVVIKYKEGRPQFVSVTRTTSIERQQGKEFHVSKFSR